jgi:hypothetical protein
MLKSAMGLRIMLSSGGFPKPTVYGMDSQVEDGIRCKKKGSP